jgi:molecular chaperone DnaK (HSP70)
MHPQRQQIDCRTLQALRLYKAPPAKRIRVRYAYDQSGIVAFSARHSLHGICKLQILRPVEKLDSRRLHQLIYYVGATALRA